MFAHQSHPAGIASAPSSRSFMQSSCELEISGDEQGNTCTMGHLQIFNSEPQKSDL